ncbi:MAG: hypothetical protein HGA27_00260 [Peptococcaceae bacterium]|nr:hypothetical protein [Peptococcaceae bacterium]
MKIDFNSHGITVNFDKVPKILYFNEEDHGCGQIFLDGVRKKGLHSVFIKAHTDEDVPRPVEYKIKLHKVGCHGYEYLAANIKSDLEIGVKILDLREFKALIKILKEIIGDEEIAEEIRKKYSNKLNVITMEDENNGNYPER